MIVRFWVWLIAPRLALIWTIVFEVTFAVAIVNATEFCPAGIVTVAGKVADVELLANVMTMPPVGAGPLIRIVPVEVPPPATLEGLSSRPTSDTGLTVSVAVWDTVPIEAVMVTDV